MAKVSRPAPAGEQTGNQPEAPGVIDRSQIEAWKNKYGDVFLLEADGHKCYLKRPTRQIISMAGVIGGEDIIKQNEILLANCWLGGDEAIKTEDRLFLAAGPKLRGIVDIAEAELKKL